MAIIYFLQDILENEDVKLDHMFIASLVADIVKVCLVNGNFRKSLRYIPLDFANRVFVNLWSRVIVSWSKRLTPTRVLNGQVSWEVLGREYFPRKYWGRKYWNRQVLKCCFMHFSSGYFVKKSILEKAKTSRMLWDYKDYFSFLSYSGRPHPDPMLHF